MGTRTVLPERWPTPEEQELEIKRGEMRRLSDEAIALEMQLETLRSQLEGFLHTRLFRLGPLYAELDDLDAQIEELLLARDPGDPVQRRRAQEARARACASEAAAAEAIEKGPVRTVHLTEELKNEYREAARRMHPDLGRTDEDRERRTEFMTRLNAAYKQCDVESVRDLVARWEASREPTPEATVAEELVRVIRTIDRLQRTICRKQADLSALRATSEYRLMLKAARVEAEGGSALDPTRLRHQIQERRDRLRDLRGEDAR